MAEKEKENPETFILDRQTDDAKAMLLNGLKVYPRNIVMHDAPHQYSGNEDLKTYDDSQQDNKEMKQNKYQSEIELDQKIENHNFVKDKNEENVNNINLIVNNSFQMRVKVLNMELNVVKTYSDKGQIDNVNDTSKRIYNIKTRILTVNTALKINDFENAENLLSKAEKLIAELMKKTKKEVNKNPVKNKVVKNHQDDIEIRNYRPSVTVRGTREDVTSCIIKAERALENGRYDKAESLLLKAERIFPTKNASDLLKHVRSAKEQNFNSENIEDSTKGVQRVHTVKDDKSKTESDTKIVDKCLAAFDKAYTNGTTKEQNFNSEHVEDATKSVQQVHTVKENESKSESDTGIVDKCLAAFDKAYTNGNFVKAEKMLIMATIFDDSLNVDDKMSLLKAAINKKSLEDKGKEDNEKIAKMECEPADESHYKEIKEFGSDDFQSSEEILHKAKSFDRALNLEPEISTVTTEVASKSINKDINKTGPEESLSETDINHAAEENKNIDKTGPEETRNRIERKISENACIQNADSTYNKNDIEIPKHYFCGAEIAFETRNLNVHHDTTTTQTEYSRFEDEIQKEIKAEMGKQRQEVEDNGKLDRKRDESEMIKVLEEQEDSLEKNNDKMNEQDINNSNIVVTRPPRKKKQVKNLISMAEKAIYDKKFEDAINLLNKAENLYPTIRAKELLANVSELFFSGDVTYLDLHCYNFPVEANYSNRIEAVNCVNVAQAAFHEGEYDKAEHFLLKSQIICYSPTIKLFLETARIAKAQTNTNVTVKIENNNEHAHSHSQNEYNKCKELTPKTVADEDLDDVERFSSNDSRIMINNALKQSYQNMGASQSSIDGINITESVKSDKVLNREKETERLSGNAKTGWFSSIRHSFERALQKLPRMETQLSQDEQIKKEIKIEARKLLVDADKLIKCGNFEQAELLLTTSWDKYKNSRTLSCHKQFVKARLALFNNQNENSPGGRISEHLFECDKLVNSALNKYDKKKFAKAEMLLKKALDLHPCIRINQLLIESQRANQAMYEKRRSSSSFL